MGTVFAIYFNSKCLIAITFRNTDTDVHTHTQHTHTGTCKHREKYTHAFLKGLVPITVDWQIQPLLLSQQTGNSSRVFMAQTASLGSGSL